ncbi:MAG: hypothetical protein ACTSYA_01840 [Candidatus Kariarchaeaceae archaeon]
MRIRKELLLENWKVKEERFEPLKITLRLKTPVVIGYPWIHFDSLVSHLLARLVMDQEFYTLPSSDPLNVVDKLPMPIKKVKINEGELYLSSASIWEPDLEALTTRIFKRFEAPKSHMIKTTKKRIRIDSGKFRGYMIKLPYLPVRKVHFHCVGDKMALGQLLHHLTTLGKKGAYGSGEIGGFRITSSYSWKESLVYEGKAIRSIPKSIVNSDEFFSLAWRAAYWDKRNRAICAPVGAEAELKEEFINAYS